MDDRNDDDQNAILPGVKKAYRPDWLNDANKIFINKLNDMCGSYHDVYGDVSSTAYSTLASIKQICFIILTYHSCIFRSKI